MCGFVGGLLRGPIAPERLDRALQTLHHRGPDAVGRWIAPDGVAGMDPYEIALSRLPVDERLAGRDPLNQALYLWAKVHLPNFILTFLSDRMEMAHSIGGTKPSQSSKGRFRWRPIMGLRTHAWRRCVAKGSSCWPAQMRDPTNSGHSHPPSARSSCRGTIPTR